MKRKTDPVKVDGTATAAKKGRNSAGPKRAEATAPQEEAKARKAPSQPKAKASGKPSSKPSGKAGSGAPQSRQKGRNSAGPQPAGELAASAAAQMLKAAKEAGDVNAQGGKSKPDAPAQKEPAAPAVVAASSGASPAQQKSAGGGVPPESYAKVRDELVQNFGLSDREARFVMELVVDENATAAYVRAGYSEQQANSCAARLNAKASIQAAAAHVRAKVAERVGYTADEALGFVADVLRADPRELVEYKVSCCRFCYGDRFMYQRTEGEMARDRAKHDAQVERRMERNKEYEDPGFDEQGGDGFDLRRPPNTECPVCAGDGQGRTVFKDTRHLSRAAAALYAGTKEGKDGVEVKMHDKAAFVDKMFRYHGLYEADNKQSAAQAADPAALIALSEAMERSREQRRAVMERRRQMGFTGD